MIELLRLPARLVARYIVRPVIDEFLDMYPDPPEAATGSVKPGYDPHSTIAGETAIAANRDHDTMEFRAGFQLPPRKVR